MMPKPQPSAAGIGLGTTLGMCYYALSLHRLHLISVGEEFHVKVGGFFYPYRHLIRGASKPAARPSEGRRVPGIAVILSEATWCPCRCSSLASAS